METKSSRSAATGEIRASLRELRAQLSLLNHYVGQRMELRDVDLDCLDLLDRAGPMSPSTLARQAGLHPATVTGILDRLQRQGWVVRERDPADRRGVVVSAQRDRAADLAELYSGMNAAITRICGGYSGEELTLIAGFLRRTIEAGQRSAEDLSESAS
ncbi:MarR family transcriptional regulator [Actinophytocola sp.]|uniref:MarR family transcriptional regulator n=1 Tax=Actinophytocola sp. TaxID=1872138 RepID=UPI002D7F98C1|nr:MarR family transcriptional regulator [Actinophytocola sp.]HET9142582.1 MarR family transcriptional regulator [Actinophytocola sp.]